VHAPDNQRKLELILTKKGEQANSHPNYRYFLLIASYFALNRLTRTFCVRPREAIRERAQSVPEQNGHKASWKILECSSALQPIDLKCL